MRKNQPLPATGLSLFRFILESALILIQPSPTLKMAAARTVGSAQFLANSR